MPKTPSRDKSRTRPTIAALFDELAFSYQVAIWTGIIDTLRACRCNSICFTGGRIRLASASPITYKAASNAIYDLLTPERVDGVIVCSNVLLHDVSFEMFQAFCRQYQPLPMVSIAGPMEGIPSVSVDNYVGMYAAVKHLITEHGYRRIAFIRGPQNSPEAEDRYRAYTVP